MFQVATGGAIGTGFDGYLQISSPTAPCFDEASFGAASPALCAAAGGCDPVAPDERCNVPILMTSLLFFNPPIRASSATPRVLPLVATSDVFPLTEAAGARLDISAGSAFIATVDCDGRPAPGVQLGTEQLVAAMMYLEGGVISTTATETDDSRERVQIGEVGLRIAPFAISYATLSPAR